MADNKTNGIYIFGAGGHARVIVEIIETSTDFAIAGIFDDSPSAIGRMIGDYSVTGNRNDMLSAKAKSGVCAAVVAIGDNNVRRDFCVWAEENGFALPAIIHRAATVAKSAKIDDGTVIMPGAVIQPEVNIGKGSIINSNATIEHHCSTGDFSHIGPGATLCGSVEIGKGAFIGAGSTVIQCLKIGNDSVVGAGASVIRDVPCRTKVAGVPAREINMERS